MKKEQKEKLLKFMEEVSHKRHGFCSDSDIEDFCEENGVKMREAYDFISEMNAPECCKGCRNVWAFPNTHPCTACSRAKNDLYAPKKQKREKEKLLSAWKEWNGGAISEFPQQ